jgi:ribosomal protein L19
MLETNFQKYMQLPVAVGYGIQYKKVPMLQKIRKNDLVQIIWTITKTRKQTIKGHCKSIQIGGVDPQITVKYKLSGEWIQQSFPLKSPFLNEVTKL